MYRLVVFAFLLTFASSSVVGEKCVGHNFESDFDDLFKSDSYICFNGEPWQLANYSSIDIADVPAGSNRFIEPRSTLTCESTSSFYMSEGTLEVNFYMKVKNDEDYLSVFVSEVTSDGHRNRGHASVSRRIPNYKDGWNTLRIDLSSSFNGFISFIGEKSEDSIVLIDSFRYFAKGHEDNCGLYEAIDSNVTADPDIVESTTKLYTWPDPESEPNPEDYTPYPTPGVETTIVPIPEEDVTTSYEPELETTPFPEEHISTLPPSELESTTYPIPEEDISTSAPSEEESTPYPVPEEDISTSAPSEEESTPYPLPEEDISTSAPPEEETTPYPVPEEELTTSFVPITEPESNDQTTNNPLVETEKCVTYNFEKDFDKLFTHNHELCGNFNKWELSNYSSNGVDTVNAKGNSYLAPSEDLSCISAFPIRMSPNGLVEVNVYIEPASELDYIIVLVKNVVEGSVDTVAGSIIYEPAVVSFVKGWNVLRINVVHLRSFDGYLIFLGAGSEGSTVLVDSFRYIPPWADASAEECQFR